MISSKQIRQEGHSHKIFIEVVFLIGSLDVFLFYERSDRLLDQSNFRLEAAGELCDDLAHQVLVHHLLSHFHDADDTRLEIVRSEVIGWRGKDSWSSLHSYSSPINSFQRIFSFFFQIFSLSPNLNLSHIPSLLYIPSFSYKRSL